MSKAEISWDELDYLEAIGDKRQPMDKDHREIILKLAKLAEQRLGKCEKWTD